jgi:hypothetical protein
MLTCPGEPCLGELVVVVANTGRRFDNHQELAAEPLERVPDEEARQADLSRYLLSGGRAELEEMLEDQRVEDPLGQPRFA